MIPKPPASLVRYLRNGRCVLFCGSGLSAWAKLPTWSGLLHQIVRQLGEEVPDDPNLEELRRLLKEGKLLEVADHCKEALGRRYNEILSEQLRGATGDIPEPHRIIAQMPFAAVVTTNYDKLLERSYAGLPKTPTHRDVDALGPLLFDGSFFILKAHGDIDRPDSMVLTTRDYQEIIHSNLAFNSIFSAILLTKAVLFVGYSLNDPDFRLLLDRQLTIFRENIPERYALMAGIGKVERDVLWRTAKIRVLPYEDGHHEQVLEFLRTLLNEVSAEPVVTASIPAPPVPPAIPASAPATAQATGVVWPHVVASPMPSTTLSIRLRGQALEAIVRSDGSAVQGSGAPPDWSGLPKLIRTAFSDKSHARLLGQHLSKLLPDIVLRALTDVPPDHVITMRLSPEVELLPWEMTEVDGEFLLMRNPLVRAPTGLSDATRGYPIVRQPARVLLIGDPNQCDGLSLPGALAEVSAIYEVYTKNRTADCYLLLGEHATFDRVAAELSSGYDVVHFAGHAWFDEYSEPFLMLSKQVKLRCSELRSLISPRPPALLILNSHFTIFAPPGASGEGVKKPADEEQEPALGGHRGFIEGASTAGVGILIGSFSGQLDDITAQLVGVKLHSALLSGEPVARALHQALRFAQAQQGHAHPSYLTYAMSGYGDITMSSGHVTSPDA